MLLMHVESAVFEWYSTDVLDADNDHIDETLVTDAIGLLSCLAMSDSASRYIQRACRC